MSNLRVQSRSGAKAATRAQISWAVTIASTSDRTTWAARTRSDSSRLELDEFGVRQASPRLIVQSMDQARQRVWWTSATVSSGTYWRSGAQHHSGLFLYDPRHRQRPVSEGSRQSVSTKIRTEPPAVRTYSTFPVVIQL